MAAREFDILGIKEDNICEVGSSDRNRRAYPMGCKDGQGGETMAPYVSVL